MKERTRDRYLNFYHSDKAKLETYGSSRSCFFAIWFAHREFLNNQSIPIISHFGRLWFRFLLLCGGLRGFLFLRCACDSLFPVRLLLLLDFLALLLVLLLSLRLTLTRNLGHLNIEAPVIVCMKKIEDSLEWSTYKIARQVLMAQNLTSRQLSFPCGRHLTGFRPLLVLLASCSSFFSSWMIFTKNIHVKACITNTTNNYGTMHFLCLLFYRTKSVLREKKTSPLFFIER